jgi:8-oxo-dGTP diphosphatase
MASSREYPERPLVGVGGVVIDQGRALLIRRASEPLRGEWSIPGGMLELGETLQEGVARELLEETGLHIRVLGLIEVFERIVYAKPETGVTEHPVKPRYHYVIADYLCERVSGEEAAASDVTDLEFVREDDLERFKLTDIALRILHKAFAMERRARQSPTK